MLFFLYFYFVDLTISAAIRLGLFEDLVCYISCYSSYYYYCCCCYYYYYYYYYYYCGAPRVSVAVGDKPTSMTAPLIRLARRRGVNQFDG